MGWLRLDWHDLFLRGEWFVVAVALVSLATIFFKRFDPDARPAVRLALPAFLRRASRAEEISGKWESALARLTPLQDMAGRGRFVAIVRAELKLLLKSIPKFVYVILAFANLIALLSPESDGPGVGVLAFLWIVPVLIWSRMGAREQASYARPLIFSAPHSFLRQLPAEWLAGFLIAAGASLGVGICLLNSQPPRAFRGLAIRCGVHCIARPGLRNLVARHTALPGPLSRMVVSGDE